LSLFFFEPPFFVLSFWFRLSTSDPGGVLCLEFPTNPLSFFVRPEPVNHTDPIWPPFPDGPDLWPFFFATQGSFRQDCVAFFVVVPFSVVAFGFHSPTPLETRHHTFVFTNTGLLFLCPPPCPRQFRFLCSLRRRRWVGFGLKPKTTPYGWIGRPNTSLPFFEPFFLYFRIVAPRNKLGSEPFYSGSVGRLARP